MNLVVVYIAQFIAVWRKPGVDGKMYRCIGRNLGMSGEERRTAWQRRQGRQVDWNSAGEVGFGWQEQQGVRSFRAWRRVLVVDDREVGVAQRQRRERAAACRISGVSAVPPSA
jgi:hypothetical protein